jgi:hypothetical protein
MCGCGCGCVFLMKNFSIFICRLKSRLCCECEKETVSVQHTLHHTQTRIFFPGIYLPECGKKETMSWLKWVTSPQVFTRFCDLYRVRLTNVFIFISFLSGRVPKMSYKINARSIHCEENGNDGRFVGSSSNRRHSLGITSTDRFATLNVFYENDNEDQFDNYDEDFDLCDDNNGEMDMEENNAPDVMAELNTQKQSLEEQMQNDEFLDDFIADVKQPILDSSYKYPRISVMVISTSDLFVSTVFYCILYS